MKCKISSCPNEVTFGYHCANHQPSLWGESVDATGAYSINQALQKHVHVPIASLREVMDAEWRDLFWPPENEIEEHIYEIRHGRTKDYVMVHVKALVSIISGAGDEGDKRCRVVNSLGQRCGLPRFPKHDRHSNGTLIRPFDAPWE